MNLNIGDWLNPDYHEGAEVWTDLTRHPDRLRNGVALDGFFLTRQADRIFQAVEHEAAFEEQYKIYGERGFVDEERFLQTPQTERMLHFRRVVGPEKGFELSSNYLAYRGLWAFCVHTLPQYLSSLLGQPVALESQVTHAHSAHHFLNTHTDAGMGRKLCAVFFLSRDWSEGDGGSLIMGTEDGGQQEINYRYNRAVLFIPSQTTWHYVAPHAEQAAAQHRIAHVTWFGGE